MTRASGLCRVVLALGVVLAACGAAEEPGPGGGGASTAGGRGSLEGRSFVATAATEGGVARRLEGEVRLDFTRPGAVGVRTGCNGGSGPARLEGDRLVVDDLAVTQIGCPPPLADQERFVLDLVLARPAASLAGDELLLRAAAAELRLSDRRVADPDRPLEGTRWAIDGTFDAQVASSAGGTDGFLVFADGRVRGSTGCRDLEGPAAVDGARVRFGPLALTGPRCSPQAAGTEATVLHVVRGEVTADVTARALRLTAADGAGITLVAG